jgi:hypothetical protein
MDVRDNRISIRLSDREQERVAQIVATARTNVSTYGRKRLLGEPVNNIVVPEINVDSYRALVELANQLKAIGNNLNQSTKVLNSYRQEGKKLPSNLDLVETIEEVECELYTTLKLLREIQVEVIGANRSSKPPGKNVGGR